MKRAPVSRVLRIWIGVLAALLLSFSAFAKAGQFAIEVQPADWGSARVDDIQTVLMSVAESFLPYFPRHASDRIVVSRSRLGPQVLAAKTQDGAYRVMLDVSDTRWDQFTYQFAHELCHIFTNFEHRDINVGTATRDYQWFEESLCEAVSLLALERAASRWEHSPPHAHWAAYAPVFREYAARLFAQTHRGLSPQLSMGVWYRAHHKELEANPYTRAKNEVIATALYALLQQTPGSLEALGYLNLETPASPASFKAFLECWSSASPQQYRAFITHVISLVEESRAADGA